MVDNNKINNTFELLTLENRMKLMYGIISYLGRNKQFTTNNYEVDMVNKVLLTYFDYALAKSIFSNIDTEIKFRPMKDEYGISGLNAILRKYRFKLVSSIKNYITKEQTMKSTSKQLIDETMEVIAQKNNWISCRILPYMDSANARTFLLEYVDMDGCIEVKKIRLSDLKDVFSKEYNVVREAWSANVTKTINETKEKEVFYYDLYSIALNHIADIVTLKGYVTSKDFADALSIIKKYVTVRYYNANVSKKKLLEYAIADQLVEPKTVRKSFNGQRINCWILKEM